jgi:hypothetical protein
VTEQPGGRTDLNQREAASVAADAMIHAEIEAVIDEYPGWREEIADDRIRSAEMQKGLDEPEAWPPGHPDTPKAVRAQWRQIDIDQELARTERARQVIAEQRGQRDAEARASAWRIDRDVSEQQQDRGRERFAG